MVSKLLVGWGLMALSVTIHAVGVSAAMRRPPVPITRLWPRTRLFVRLAGWIVFLHLVEILSWGLVYVWVGAMPELQSAIYFGAVTYTTTGYGDLVLPPEWRLVGAIEALTGILMCGWSTGFFFAIVSRMIAEERNPLERRL